MIDAWPPSLILVIILVLGAVAGFVIGRSQDDANDEAPTLAWETLEGNLQQARLVAPADPAEGVRQHVVGFHSSLKAFLQRCLEVGDQCPIFNDGIPSLPGRPPVNAAFVQ